MGYDVYWDDDAVAELKQLQQRRQRSVARVAASRGENPWAGDVESIHGGDGLLRVRAGAHRVIYHVDDLDRWVIIVAVMPRRDKYPKRTIRRWIRRRDQFLESQ